VFRDLASYRVYRRAALNASDDGELAIDPNRLISAEPTSAGIPPYQATVSTLYESSRESKRVQESSREFKRVHVYRDVCMYVCMHVCTCVCVREMHME
jgi:hypothetical protein